jgi:hypothetical protein
MDLLTNFLGKGSGWELRAYGWMLGWVNYDTDERYSYNYSNNVNATSF